VLVGCGGSTDVERLVTTLHSVRPHDELAFTEGLEVEGDTLYESSGREGTSNLRAINLATGEDVSRRTFPAPIFAEGIGIDGERIVQLTWKGGVAYISSRVDLRPLGTYRYDGEGWGLCMSADGWVMSNGSDTLSVRDRTTFTPKSTIHVTLEGKPVDQLNELECVGDQIYANVWKTSRILRIEKSGRVSAVIDASNLPVSRPDDPDAVLNGIAYLPATRRFLLTGKLWPSMFEVTFEAATP
jgi:glutamine cyclotransferase